MNHLVGAEDTALGPRRPGARFPHCSFGFGKLLPALQRLGREQRIPQLFIIAGRVKLTAYHESSERTLRAHSGTLEDFQLAVGLDGGDVELGSWYAQRLYNLAERGRMLGTWHDLEDALVAGTSAKPPVDKQTLE